MPVLELTLISFFAFLFLFSGAAKLRAVRRFRDQIAAFGVVPWRVAPVLAVSIPLAELAVGAALLMRVQPAASLAAALALLALFTGFIAWVLASKRKAACFCFGEEDGEISGLTLARNVILLALAAGAFAFSGSVPPASGMLSLLAGLYALSGVLLFVSAFHLLGLWKTVRSLL